MNYLKLSEHTYELLIKKIKKTNNSVSLHFDIVYNILSSYLQSPLYIGVPEFN